MIQLQERDKRLLKLCYEHQFITLEHVHFEFPGTEDRNARRRIKAFEEEGLLVQKDAFNSSRRHVYKLTQLGQELARGLSRFDLFQDRGLNFNEIDHDALVASVRQRLELIWPSAEFRPEGVLVDSEFGGKPDGIFAFASGRWIPIEIERTDKGKTRFTELTERWLRLPQIFFVLYVAATAEMEVIIKRYLTEAPTPQPMGLVGWDALEGGRPEVWNRKKPLNMFERSY